MIGRDYVGKGVSMGGLGTYCRSIRPKGPRCRPRRWAPRASWQLRVLYGDRELTLWYSPHWGYRPHSLDRFRDGSTETILFFPVMEVGSLKKRTPQAANGTGPKNLAAVESRVFGSLMNIIGHLADVRYDDGTPRQPGTLFIKTLGGAWSVTAKEPDAQAALPVVANSLDDALAALDLLLGADDAPWEIDPWARGKHVQGGKKKT